VAFIWTSDVRALSGLNVAVQRGLYFGNYYKAINRFFA
jgi:hypothetical protein